MPRYRAASDAAAMLASATGMLAVTTSWRSVRSDHHAQRLLREAAFLLVFGSRPAIRDALLDRLGTEISAAAPA